MAAGSDRNDVRDTGLGAQDFSHLFCDRISSLQGGTLRQLDHDEEIALVFDRQERRRDARIDAVGQRESDAKEREHQPASGNRMPYTACVNAGQPIETAVELAEEDEMRLPPMPEQNSAQRRAKGQRVNRRKRHRNGNRQRELVVKPAGNPGQEGYRHKHRHQHRGGGDDRTGDLAHRLLRCL